MNNNIQIRGGLHASNADWTTAPSSPSFLNIEEMSGLAPRDRTRIETTTMRGDGRKTASIVGPQALDAIDLTFRLQGMNGNTGGAVASATASPVSNMLTAIFGNAATDPSGASTNATAGVGSVNTLTVTSGTNIPNGSIIAFRNTAGKWFFRRVVSGGGTTSLTLDQPYDGSALTSGNTVYRAPVWALDPATVDHTHFGFDVESFEGGSLAWRRRFIGAMSSAQFDFPEGANAKVSTSWQFTTMAVDNSASGVTYSAPTAGNDVVNVSGELRIGGQVAYCTSLKVDLGSNIQPRKAMDGPNGVLGCVVAGKRPVITCDILLGSLSGQMQDNSGTVTQRTLQEAASTGGVLNLTQGVGIMVGGGPTQGCYWSIPAAQIKAAHKMTDGQQMLTLTIEPTASSQSADLYFGLF